MRHGETITIDALDRDPFPHYARLRAEDPVAPVPAANCWFATRWSDVEQIARSPDFTAVSDEAPVNAAFGRPNVLTSEGSVHAALRGGIEPHYRPRQVAGYIDHLVRPIAEAQLAAFRASGSDDLLTGYFEPISALALARSFGFMEVDVPTLRRWFHGLSQGAINFERDPARDAICQAVGQHPALVGHPQAFGLTTGDDVTHGFPPTSDQTFPAAGFTPAAPTRPDGNPAKTRPDAGARFFDEKSVVQAGRSRREGGKGCNTPGIS